MYKVDNAIIMAAGTSSRFAPLSFEKHKALIEVRGEVLIERQIRQLLEAGIKDIYVVTGYKAADFAYLEEKFSVQLIHNPNFLNRNNHSSVYVVRDILKNSYLCSADNYFNINPFKQEVDTTYYAAVYSDGYTDEWCMVADAKGDICNVTIGGTDSWYMLGHTFWSEEFSQRFIEILESEYSLSETKDKFWEKIFIAYLDVLKMKMKKYDKNDIFEFDTLDELRQFDTSYINDTRSKIIRDILVNIGCKEAEIINIKTVKASTAESIGFEFDCRNKHYRYLYKTRSLVSVV